MLRTIRDSVTKAMTVGHAVDVLARTICPECQTLHTQLQVAHERYTRSCFLQESYSMEGSPDRIRKLQREGRANIRAWTQRMVEHEATCLARNGEARVHECRGGPETMT